MPHAARPLTDCRSVELARPADCSSAGCQEVASWRLPSFDSVGCLVDHVDGRYGSGADIRSTWLSNDCFAALAVGWTCAPKVRSAHIADAQTFAIRIERLQAA